MRYLDGISFSHSQSAAARGGFVRAEDAEVMRACVEPHHVAQKMTEDACRFGVFCARLAHLHIVIPKIRHRVLNMLSTTVATRLEGIVGYDLPESV